VIDAKTVNVKAPVTLVSQAFSVAGKLSNYLFRTDTWWVRVEWRCCFDVGHEFAR
jgi:hypothetical protein